MFPTLATGATGGTQRSKVKVHVLLWVHAGVMLGYKKAEHVPRGDHGFRGAQQRVRGRQARRWLDDIVDLVRIRGFIRRLFAHRDVEVHMNIQTLILLRTGVRYGDASTAVVYDGCCLFGSVGKICEEAVRAGCGPITKTLPDRLSLHLLRFHVGIGARRTGRCL